MIRKITNGLETFLQSDAGQRFFNIAFSLGAAIVIWGALFMILNLPGGRTLLCIGMGTEILMFILTAFERPAKEYYRNEVQLEQPKGTIERLDSLTIINDLPEGRSSGSTDQKVNIAANSEVMTSATQFVEALDKISQHLTSFQETMAANISGYSQQVVELNKNIAGLNSLYELQLKNVSGQLSSMDGLSNGLKNIKEIYEKSASESEHYFEETEKMTQYLKQINAVYSKMITAMKAD